MNHQTQITRQQVARKLDEIKGWRRIAPGETIKNCQNCGRSYRIEEWLDLPCRGSSEMPSDGEPPWIEYRDCPCRSTLSIMLDDKKQPIVQVKNRLTTIAELGRLAEKRGSVNIPNSKIWKGKNIPARLLMEMRGTELEVLFALGIEAI